jgi:translation initiation factor 1
LLPGEQEAHIQRQTKGRGGKTVIVIMNLKLTPKDAKALSKKLKQGIGTGGAVKDDTIEIQGDNRDRVAEILQKLGYKTKFVGG